MQNLLSSTFFKILLFLVLLKQNILLVSLQLKNKNLASHYSVLRSFTLFGLEYGKNILSTPLFICLYDLENEIFHNMVSFKVFDLPLTNPILDLDAKNIYLQYFKNYLELSIAKARSLQLLLTEE